MKFNIPIKIFIVFVIFSSIFLVLFFTSTKSVEDLIVSDANKTVAQGVLISLEQKLIEKKTADWNTVIRKTGSNYLTISLMSKLDLPLDKKNMLKKGQITFQTGKNYQFLNLGFVSHTAYKKVGNTSYVISYSYSNPIQYISRYMRPAINLITNDILSKPDKLWAMESLRLEKVYGLSDRLIIC